MIDLRIVHCIKRLTQLAQLISRLNMKPEEAAMSIVLIKKISDELNSMMLSCPFEDENNNYIPTPKEEVLVVPKENMDGTLVSIQDKEGNTIMSWTDTDFEIDPTLAIGSLFGAFICGSIGLDDEDEDDSWDDDEEDSWDEDEDANTED